MAKTPEYEFEHHNPAYATADLRPFRFMGRIHPTAGYQWWNMTTEVWHTGEQYAHDVVIPWERTWAEPEE